MANHCFPTIQELANSPNHINETIRYGWRDTPNERGTLQIIWSCVSALFLCLWTMLHLNLPGIRDTRRTKFWRKLRWLALGIMAPEVVMLFASGQRSSAKRSVAFMHSLGYNADRWTLEHAFYADAGGFLLQTRDKEAFPLSAKQLGWLVSKKLVPLPDLTIEEIWDKSKADKLTKSFTFAQIGWLVAQTLGRVAQGLPVTPIELSTISLSCTSLTTLIIWLRKPLDVGTPMVLHIPITTTDLLNLQGLSADTSWQDTPLESLEPKVYMSSKWSQRSLTWILRHELQTRPLSRIPNDRDPQANNLGEHMFLAIATATFAMVHLAGWNYDFAMDWERILWRTSCLVICALLMCYGSTEVFICYKENYRCLGLDTGGGYKLRWPACLLFHVPAALYSVARLFLMLEAVISLRSLPSGAYEDVEWSHFIPHL